MLLNVVTITLYDVILDNIIPPPPFDKPVTDPSQQFIYAARAVLLH